MPLIRWAVAATAAAISAAAAAANLDGSALLDSVSPDQALVTQHVATTGNQTFREAAGELKFPYLVPSGPYDQLWDWDSMFTGVALLNYGSSKYFAGAMLNFLDATNVSTGEVEGCLLPSGATGTIYHAKPLIIQGSWLSAKHGGPATLAQFLPYRDQMRAQLDYWIRERRDNATGLYVWFDQLESGQDNLVLSTCPSDRSPECWNATLHAKAIAGADIMTFLYREFKAFEKFNQAWASASTGGSPVNQYASVDVVQLSSQAQWAQDEAANVQRAVDKYLWVDDQHTYAAANLSVAAGGFERVSNRVGLAGFPLFGGLASKRQAAALRDTLWHPDLMSKFGLRSTGSKDSRYSNENMIKPYSNWRGPIWVNENVVVSYGLMDYGYHQEAQELATRVLAVLADDLRNNKTWHEGYSAETGVGLAAPGFLSWNTLAADWSANLAAKHNPLAL